MRLTRILSTVALLALGASLVLAQGEQKPMINDDVVAMVKAGLPEDVIVSAIQAQATNFDGSAAALVELNKQGVSSKVLQAMLAEAGKHRDTAGATPAGGPGARGMTAPPAGATDQNPQGEAFAPAAPQQPAGRGAGNQKSASGSEAGGGAPAKSGGGGGGGGGSIFDKLNQTISGVNGTVQSARGSGQNAKDAIEGAGTGQGAGAAGAKGKGGAAPAAAQKGAASAASQALPTQAVQVPQQAAASTSALTQGAKPAPAADTSAQTIQQMQQQIQDLRQQQAATAAAQRQEQTNAAQAQRQQRVAAAQAQANKAAACREQVTKDHPQGGPDVAKEYLACVQQGSAPAAPATAAK
jgi:hypothetical protein